ncbi:MAG TPA: lysylphosphatidylglycerol synthase transmembrane domain-containing protein [Stellaceae bacterium]|nr:lysylphosphatidylglycerol synthase transmembrane domain-containing protein [Stellaceae bacterium]
MPADVIAATSEVPPPSPRGRLRLAASRPVALGLKLAISGALIALVCRHVDAAAMAERFAGQSVVWLAAAGLIGVVQVGLLGLRWERILVGLNAGIGTRTVLAVTAMGSFFNAWLLGPTGGDVTRAMLAPARSLGRMGIVHSVLFERVATMAGMGIVVAPLVVLDVGPFARSLPLLIALAVVPLPFLGMAVVGWLAEACAGRGGAVFAGLREIAGNWRRLCRAWPHFAAAIVIAVLGQAAIAAEAWALAQAQHLPVTFLDFLMLMPPVMLVAALPVSAGGWGVREGAMVAALGAAGVAAGPAMLLSVELGLVAMLVSLPGGGVWLHRWFARQPALAPAPR